MDQNKKSLLELFNTLLENLGLQQNIYGYILSITLLTILLAFKLFIVNCIVRHFRNCKRNHFQIEDLDIWISVMQYLEYLVIIAGIFFGLTLLWLWNVTGILDCLKTGNQIKSASNCLEIIITTSDKILADNSRAKKNKQTNQNIGKLAVTESTPNRLQPYTV